MKVMKVGAVVICTAMSAFATPAKNVEQVAELTTSLESGGVAGMLATAKTNGWDCPWIPDKWHVKNVVEDAEIVKVASAGREFGVRLAVELEKAAESFQHISPSQSLYEKSMEMCELSEWVNKPDGIGNLLLTGRCLDLASIGLGRLVADMNIPLETCQTLAGRIRGNGKLIDVPRRAEILDLESGAKFFSKCRSDDDMQRAWVDGARGDGSIKEGFFAHVWRPVPPTVLNLIKKGSSHAVACAGVGSRSTIKALGLLDFRREIGYFPKPWVRSEEERIILEKEIALYEKFGAKITPAENDHSFDPLREAFDRAWRKKVPDMKRINEYIDGFNAYKEISEGRFFDEDTNMLRQQQKIEQRRQEWERLPESQAAEGRHMVP